MTKTKTYYAKRYQFTGVWLLFRERLLNVNETHCQCAATAGTGVDIHSCTISFLTLNYTIKSQTRHQHRNKTSVTESQHSNPTKYAECVVTQPNDNKRIDSYNF